MTTFEHGTLTGYVKHKCRCPRCRKAKATYNRERGYNRRNERKRRYNREYDRAHHKCAKPECDTMVSREARLCLPCRHEEQRKRMVEVQQLWLQGKSYADIAEIVGTTTGTINVTVSVMRKQGWDMPKRGPGGKVLV